MDEELKQACHDLIMCLQKDSYIDPSVVSDKDYWNDMRRCAELWRDNPELRRVLQRHQDTQSRFTKERDDRTRAILFGKDY